MIQLIGRGDVVELQDGTTGRVQALHPSEDMLTVETDAGPIKAPASAVRRPGEGGQ